MIQDKQGDPWTIVGYRPSQRAYVYELDRSLNGKLITLNSWEIEKNYAIPGKTPPKYPQKIMQGKWDCGPSAMAMFLGANVNAVKKECGKIGWRNDDAGISKECLINCAKSFRVRLLEVSEISDKVPQLIFLDSLNIQGMAHLLYWNGSELIDSNAGIEGRNWWSPNWKPSELVKVSTVLIQEAPQSGRKAS